jgi:small subunit ribosomal protein S13
MPRISGVDIPANKPLRVALRYIHGIGPAHAEQIVRESGLDGHTRAGQLTEDQVSQIGTIIENSYVVEGALRRQVGQNVQRLRDIRCYRGERHRMGLPCRGQATQTNARTRKGKRKTVAGKKSAKGVK